MSDQYSEDAITPDLDEVEQLEPEAACLDVDVRGPVRVHALPSRHAIMHQVTVGTTPVQIMGRDLRRARVLLWAVAEAAAAYYVGTRDDETAAGTAAAALAAADDGSGGAPMVLELRHSEPLYVRAVTGTVTVSFVVEQWAD